MRPATVDQYLAAQPEAAQAALRRVRDAIRRALPKHAEEVISYNMPAFRLPEGIAIYFAGWKNHYSLYPATAVVVRQLQAALALAPAACEITKGTIRFPFARPVPIRLIARIARLRAREISAKHAPPSPKRPVRPMV